MSPGHQVSSDQLWDVQSGWCVQRGGESLSLQTGVTGGDFQGLESKAWALLISGFPQLTQRQEGRA